MTSLICFSHLRWDFVFQRPQHLMSRFAKERQGFYFEEALSSSHVDPFLESNVCDETGVVILRPHIPESWDHARRNDGMLKLLDDFLIQREEVRPVCWF